MWGPTPAGRRRGKQYRRRDWQVYGCLTDRRFCSWGGLEEDSHGAPGQGQEEGPQWRCATWRGKGKEEGGGRRMGSEVTTGSGFTGQHRSRLWSEAWARDLFYRRFSTTWQLALKSNGWNLAQKVNSKMEIQKRLHIFTIMFDFFLIIYLFW